MVKETEKGGETVYACEECGFLYEDRRWAEKCQVFCAEHQACSIEITQHGVAPG